MNSLSGDQLRPFVFIGVVLLCFGVQADRKCGSALLRDYNLFPRQRTCEPFEQVDNVCSLAGFYEFTRMPNFVNHGSQDEAHQQLNAYRELISTQCSRDLLLLLCLYHFPLCRQGVVNPVVPCKGLCERVRDSCNPVIRRFNRTWPEQLDCTALPENPYVMCHGMDEPEVCVSGTESRDRTHNEEAERLSTRGSAAEVMGSDGQRKAESLSMRRGMANRTDVTSRGHDGATGAKRCHWETKKCTRYCQASISLRLTGRLVWAAVGKVIEVRIGNNCKTALYPVNVTHVLRGRFSAGKVLNVRGCSRQTGRYNCLCPILQPDEIYFIARRSFPASENCQRGVRRSMKTVCSLQHQFIGQHLSKPWPASASLKQLRNFLNNQGFPRWLKHVITFRLM